MIETREHYPPTSTIGETLLADPPFLFPPSTIVEPEELRLPVDCVRVILLSETSPKSFVVDPDGDYLLIARISSGSELRYDVGHGLRMCEIRCGHVLVRPAKHESSWRLERPEQTVILRISEPALRDAWESDSNDPWLGLVSMDTFRQDSLLAELIARLCVEIRSVRQVNRTYIRTLLFQLTTHLVRRYSEAVDTSSKGIGMPPGRLRKVVSYVMEHLETDLPLQKLAEVAGLSRYYFCREFKKSMGLTPQRYIIRQRIERAKALLEHGSLSITEISQQLCFSTPSHFTATFRRLIGVTPRSFRI
jgi:AraC family transcriptional regulator